MIQDTHLPEQDNKVTPLDTIDEIDLTDLIRQLWVKRLFILKVLGIFLLFGLFIALFSPVKYTAHCTVVPQTGKNNSNNNLGGIAAVMGVNIGAQGTGETLSPMVYPQIVKSVLFTREIMQTPIRVEKSEGKEITLYEFYADKKYQPFNLVTCVKKHTIGLPGILIGAILGNKNQEIDISTDNTLPTLSRMEEQVYLAIQNSMLLNLNSKEGYITINYTFPEAEASARITNKIRKTLEQYVITFKSEKAEDDLNFVEQSFNIAKNDFFEKQGRLTNFQDANRGLTTASARANEQRLRSEYEIAFTIYNELAKQLEQAKLAVKESKPVLTVVEPVVVPVQKSAPRRVFILAIFIFLGGIVSIGWIFIKPFIFDIIQNIKGNPEL